VEAAVFYFEEIEKTVESPGSCDGIAEDDD
jgi:hypothetical protein